MTSGRSLDWHVSKVPTVGLEKSSRIIASELSLQLHYVPTVSIKIFEDRNDPILFFARFLAEYHAS
jgi:hypothetical protein